MGKCPYNDTISGTELQDTYNSYTLNILGFCGCYNDLNQLAPGVFL